jgi:hypothetical protein
MLTSLLGRLRYANVVATLALVVAVIGGGSAIAEPVANGAATLAGKVSTALKLGKQANKRSKRSARSSAQALQQAQTANQTADRALAASANAFTKDESKALFLGATGTAANAQQLDGLDSKAFLPATAPATDADKLGGLAPGAYARAGQAATAGPRLIDQGNHDCTEEDGPSVTVQVGASGLVAVYAEVTMGAGSTDPGRQLRVQLFEPTVLPSCETIMRESALGSNVRRTLPGNDAGTTGRGSWLLYQAPPGERTFSLRYGHTGNGFGIFAVVNNRYLYVVPL